MKRFLLFLLAKCGFILSSVGQLKLDSAISGFVQAKKDLEDAIIFEGTVVLKVEEDIDKLLVEYERKKRDLKDRKITHEKISKDSAVYLKKITKFLSTEEGPTADADTDRPEQSSD